MYKIVISMESKLFSFVNVLSQNRVALFYREVAITSVT